MALGAKNGPFWKILHIQVKIYPTFSIEPKYGDFYSNMKSVTMD